LNPNYFRIPIDFGKMRKKEIKGNKKIKIWWLTKGLYKTHTNRNTVMTWGNSSSKSYFKLEIDIHKKNCMKFMYSIQDHHSKREKKYQYKVKLLETPCNFGGVRYWFECPVCRKNKRVAVLYLNEDKIGCRECQNLTYACRNLSGIRKLYGVNNVIPKRYTYKRKTTKKYQNYLNKETKIKKLDDIQLIKFSKKIEDRMEKIKKN